MDDVWLGLNRMELMIVGTVAVLLLGSKLPCIARSIVRSRTEFKKRMQD